MLITGAGRGLGFSLTRVFLTNGWKVLGLVRSGLDLNLQREWARGTLQVLQADVASDRVQETIGEALEASGAILDVLINNAGLPGIGLTVQESEPQELIDLFQVHCAGSLRCARASLPFLRRSSQPLIVNISSRLGSFARNASGEFSGRQFSYAYRIAKAAQNMLTLCLAQDLGPQGITVCAVHPGLLKTACGSSDATTDPGLAAERLLQWIVASDTKANGRCYELDVGIMDW